jgi:NarL family two-component system response regulator LiaR
VNEAVPLKKHILIYGLCGGALIVALKLIEYRFLVVEHSVEIYGGLIAAVFAVLGIWLGLKLTGRKEVIVEREILIPAEPFVLN